MTDIEKDMVYIQGQIDLHASQQKEQAQELMEAQVKGIHSFRSESVNWSVSAPQV